MESRDASGEVDPVVAVGGLLRGAKAGPEGDARTVEPALVVWFWVLFACGWLSFTLGSVLLLAAAPLAAVVHLRVERARARTLASWTPPRPDLGERSPLD